VRSNVSVLTPTIEGREDFLFECKTSVEYQGYPLVEHIIRGDVGLEGCATTINRCAAVAEGKWYVPLADDDLLLPGCIERLMRTEYTSGADVVYAPPLVTGNEDRWWFFQAPPAIPSFGLIRRELWEDLGGYDETLAHEEDRDFWTRALDAGANFFRVDEPCWVYRQHDNNKSFNKAAA
jgi:glycosyltransferase involved in cell wall biosynthesis